MRSNLIMIMAFIATMGLLSGCPPMNPDIPDGGGIVGDDDDTTDIEGDDDDTVEEVDPADNEDLCEAFADNYVSCEGAFSQC